MAIVGIGEKDDQWAREAAALLKVGWLGIGYTVVSRTDARRKLALAADLDSQSALEQWLHDSQSEGYVVAIRYYVAKAPSQMKNSDFTGPLLLRHSSLGHEVIAELLPLTLDAKGRDALVEALALRNVAEEFAFLADVSRLGGRMTRH